MEILIGSGLFGLVFGIIVPIIYFFRSRASVAVGWLFLGWSVAGIGGCVGFADFTKQAANEMDKVIKEKKQEMRKLMDDTKEDFRKQFGNPKAQS